MDHAAPELEEKDEIAKEDQGPGWDISRTQADSFLLPRQFPTSARMLRLPDVIPVVSLSHLAILKIYIIISAIEMEVGWLGTAKKLGKHVLVDDIFLFDQSVNYGQTELNTDSMASVMQDVLTRPNGEDIFNNIRFWGHSHGTGGTEPSGQDDMTMNTFRDFGSDFFLRGIFNRRGEVSFSLYDWKNNVQFDKLPWKVKGPRVSNAVYQQLKQDLLAEMQAKVKYLRPMPMKIGKGYKYKHKPWFFTGVFGPRQ
ncbi:MAG: hypothetical protein V4690_02605 [Patescibacteria group bacterium]